MPLLAGRQHRVDASGGALGHAHCGVQSSFGPAAVQTVAGPVICPGKGKCPAVVDKMIVYRDDHHLTATFAASLAPILGDRLPAVGPDAP